MRLFLMYISIVSLMTSCCVAIIGYQIDISYKHLSNLNSEHTVKVIRTDKNDLSQIIDTVQVFNINAENEYSFKFDISVEDQREVNEQYSYIFFIEGLNRYDTLNNITIKQKCKTAKISYQWNGVKMDSKEVVVE